MHMLGPMQAPLWCSQGSDISCSSSARASGMDAWHLTAAEYLASSCRSVLLALAVLHVRSLSFLPTRVTSLLHMRADFLCNVSCIAAVFWSKFWPLHVLWMLHPLRPYSGAQRYPNSCNDCARGLTANPTCPRGGWASRRPWTRRGWRRRRRLRSGAWWRGAMTSTSRTSR